MFCGFPFPFLGNAVHELKAKINQHQLRPLQRIALVNSLKSFCNLSGVFRGQRLSFYVTASNVDNGSAGICKLCVTGKLFVWQKKKVRLVDCGRLLYVDFQARNVVRRGE